MAHDLGWTPLGAGAVAMGASPAAGLPPFPGDIVRAASSVDLGPEAVMLAWEIVRLAAGLSSEEQRALLLLVLAALAVGSEGSTRLPLSSDGPLARRLSDLGAREADVATVDRLVAAARAVVAEGARDRSRRAEGVAESLAEVVGGPRDYRPLILDRDHLYVQRMHALEARVAAALAARIAGGPGETPASHDSAGIAAGRAGETLASHEAALADVVARPVVVDGPGGAKAPVQLSNPQLDAVRAALQGTLAVVSGLPGSGKTAIVATVLRVLVRLGYAPASIALAAPTGKAADRMRGSIASQLRAIDDPSEADLALLRSCPQAATLHRTLGYAPSLDRFRHHEGNMLSERVVVVDESSMIDLFLMDRLLRAVAPDARLVLLGDADQLPSVEAGAVFGDLCRAGSLAASGRVVMLRESYRAEESAAGRRILEAADCINRRDAPALSEAVVVREDAGQVAFAGVEHLSPGTADQRNAFLARWHDRIETGLSGLAWGTGRVFDEGTEGFDAETTQAIRALHRELERHRILCVTRIPSGGTGAVAVNDWFHRRVLAAAGRPDSAGGSSHFLVGEPVLVTRNDYSRHLYNGDSGMVLRVRPEGEDEAEPMAVFPRADGFAAFPLEALRGRLDLAWATTVHKAQGSEYENVALILPDVPMRLLTKEVLYTAVTRAKGSVVIVGAPDRLAEGARRAMDRYSGVADGLG